MLTRRFAQGGRRFGILLGVLLFSLGTPQPSCFREFVWLAAEPDVHNERLCSEAAEPDAAPDTTFIDCRIEGDSFAPPSPTPRSELVVLAYNLERGFEIDAQLSMILDDPAFPVPDVLLLSEVDRGCQRTGFRNIAREFAEALGFYYVYATEFVELPADRGTTGPWDPPLCEHGNAIVARYPLGNVRAIRHQRQVNWYTPPGHPNPDEPRLGGRVAVAADMRVGNRLVRLYSLHLESDLLVEVRDSQLREVLLDARGVLWPVVIGGDLNTYEAILHFIQGNQDPNFDAAFDAGFRDSHEEFPLLQRYTSFDPIPLLLDVIFLRGALPRDPGLCPREICGSLSDHLPVWTTAVLCDAEDLDCDGVPEPQDPCPLWAGPDCVSP